MCGGGARGTSVGLISNLIWQWKLNQLRVNRIQLGPCLLMSPYPYLGLLGSSANNMQTCQFLLASILSGLWNNGQALDHSAFLSPEPPKATRGIIGSSLLISGLGICLLHPHLAPRWWDWPRCALSCRFPVFMVSVPAWSLLFPWDWNVVQSWLGLPCLP